MRVVDRCVTMSAGDATFNRYNRDQSQRYWTIFQTHVTKDLERTSIREYLKAQVLGMNEIDKPTDDSSF